MLADRKHQVLIFMGMVLACSLWAAIPEAIFWDRYHDDIFDHDMGEYNEGVFWYFIADDGTAVITDIGEEHGYGDDLTSVTIPAKLGGHDVSRIGYFYKENDYDPPEFYQPLPSRLQTIAVESGSKYFTAVNNVLYSADRTVLYQFPSGRNDSSFTVPSGVKFIYHKSFHNNKKNLCSVILPNGVTEIGYQAFEDCHVLSSINLPNTLTRIWDLAFEECLDLSAITIPASVIQIGVAPFPECTSLTAISVAAGNKHYSSQDGVLFNYDKTTLIQYPAGRPASSYSIPRGVKTIGNGAFEDATISSVTIPNTVTTIEPYAFWDTRLTAVTIPASVTSIGYGAFSECVNLTKENVTFLGDLPDGVEDAFDFGAAFLPGLDDYDWEVYGRWSDEIMITGYHGTGGDITIPKLKYQGQYEPGQYVTKIAEAAFAGNETLTSVTLPVNLYEIEDFAFAGCTNLAAFAVDKENYNFQAVDGVLYRGTTLVAYPAGKTASEFTVPDWVTEIKAGAFSGCANLATVYIGTEDINMSEYAFDQDEDLTIVSDNDDIVRWRRSFPNMTIKGLPRKLTVDGMEYTYGKLDRIEITAIAPDGFAFQRWIATGVYLSSPTSRTASFDMPANDVTLVSSWCYSQALQAGWSVITPALDLDAESRSLLEGLKAYGLGSINAYARGGEFPAGKSLWVYSQSVRSISLSGLAPAGWSFAPTVGWNFLGAVRRVEEIDWRGQGAAVWEWQEGGFRRKLNGPLDTGIGYWIRRSE